MAIATVTAQYAKAGHWGFSAGDTLSGGETTYDVAGEQIAVISQYGRDLLIKGLSIRFVRALAGVEFRPAIWSSTPGAGPVAHYLDTHTTTIMLEGKHYTPLEIPTALSAAVFFRMSMVGVLADVIRLSMWGTFIPGIPVEPTPDEEPGLIESLWDRIP